MTNSQSKIYDFVAIPRYITNHYIDGRLTKPEYQILDWIWHNTNPYNGFFNTSYGSINADLHLGIEESSVRKIVASLRKKQYIHFDSHKGKAGSFPIYPINFRRTDGIIQSLDYFKRKKEIQNQPQNSPILRDKPGSNSDPQSHNLKQAINGLTKHFSAHSKNQKATSPYNYNKKDINHASATKGKDGRLEKYRGRDITQEIVPNNLFPRDNEEQSCKEIALDLGATGMRFLIIALEKYKYIFIEQAWDEFQKLPRDGMENPAKAFNDFMDNKAKQSGIY